MQSSLFIWDPDDLAAVIRGTVPATCLPPAVDAFDMSQLTHSGTPPFPQLATAMAQYGGAWWEPKSQTLFVSAAHAEWQGEWRPVVHAFKVAA